MCRQIDSFATVWSIAKVGSSNIAPRLSLSKLHLIRDIIQSQMLTTSQMAEEVECSKLTIINIRRNVRHFRSVHAPLTRIGRRRTVTPLMMEVLCDHLYAKPGLHLDDVIDRLGDIANQVRNLECRKECADQGRVSSQITIIHTQNVHSPVKWLISILFRKAALCGLYMCIARVYLDLWGGI